MNTDSLIQRAALLFEQNRFTEAAAEIKKVLQEEPERIQALHILIQCQIYNDQYEEAIATADNTLKLDPTDPFTLYFKAHALHQDIRHDKALKFIESAISYYPLEADFFGLKSSILGSKKNFQGALDSANEGLALDAENILCLNQRAQALQKLGLHEESYDTIKEALNEDPENAYTHSNLGFALLEKGEYTKAMEHFREALRIDPNSEYARQGMLHSLKSTNMLYSLWLKYAFWMQNMPSGKQFGIIFGLYLFSRFISSYSESFGNFQFIGYILTYAYIIFAVSTWIIEPISNLFLRFHSFGKYVLNEKERKASSYVGSSALVSIIGWTVFYLTDSIMWKDFGFLSGLFGITWMIVLSSIFGRGTSRGKARIKLFGYGYIALSMFVIVINFISPAMASSLMNTTIYAFLGFQIFSMFQK